MNEEILIDTELPEEPRTVEEIPFEESLASDDTENEPKETEGVDEHEEEVEALRAELDALRAELEEKRAAFERMSLEINEFSELFPSVPVTSVPDSVRESVKNGIPLSAAYALYEKRVGIIKRDAERVNARNSSFSTGPVGREPVTDFFSADEVRAMSREEVRKNYSKIMESMKKWN